MWVRGRRWTDSGYWEFGKIHWMREPWATACGLAVTDDWATHEKMPRLDWPELCKKCGGTSG